MSNSQQPRSQSSNILGHLPHPTYNTNPQGSHSGQEHSRQKFLPRGGKQIKAESKSAESSETKMSQYEVNPVGALQERFQSRGLTPTYRMVLSEGASHAPTFSFQVILGDLTSTGSGNSKKRAKHAAARAMLDMLDGRATQDGVVPLPPAPVANGGQNPGPGNTVGALQELCVKHGYNMPTYTMGQVGGQPHQRTFTMVCKVGQCHKSGTGLSKKDAKREAAQMMIDKLKAMGPNRGTAVCSSGDQAVADDLSVTDEEMEEIMKILARKRMEPITDKFRIKCTNFFMKLSTPKCRESLKKLTDASKEKDVDPVKFLEDFSKAHDLQVTYMKMDEKSDVGEVQYIVQISSEPLAVCMGQGPDDDKAKKNAARIALNYIRYTITTATKK